MELVTTKTELGTPVGTAKGKVVHLLWLSNGDDIWALCDRKVRGREIIVRDEADVTCTGCEDERDYRAAKAAGFKHHVTYSSQRQAGSPIAGSRSTYLCLDVHCFDCAPEGERPVSLWKVNGGRVADAEYEVRQHFLKMWREHKAAEREAARVAEQAARNRRVTIGRRVLRDAIELVGVDTLKDLPAQDQADAVYDRFLSDTEWATSGAIFTAGDLAQALAALEARTVDGGHALSHQEQAAWMLERFGTATTIV